MDQAINLEEQLASMKAMMKRHCKESAQKDAQIKRQNKRIANLTKELEKRPIEASNKCSSAEESDKESNHSQDSDEKHKSKKDSSLHLLSIEQIQSLVADAVKFQLGEGSFKTDHYSKPYTKRIVALKMPLGYQPPKFQQFDGKENPKQHIAHFIETCNNAGTYDNLLVKQFVRSLKGLAFDWYADLDSASIDSWE